MNGRWDVVLPEVTCLKMPKDKLQDLYVDVFMDLVELCELDAARTLMYKSDMMSRLRLENPKNSAKNIVHNTIQGVGMSLTAYIPAINLSIKPKAILNTSKIGKLLKYFVYKKLFNK